MGSAVSSVSGMLGSTVGSVVSPIAGAVGGAAGQGLGALAQGIISAIPDIPIANQGQVQGQINNNTQNAQNYQAQQARNQIDAYNATDRAIYGVQAGQGAINTAQGAVNNAQQVNQGPAVNGSIGLLGQTAAGGGPAQQAANAQLQSGTDSAIRTQQAMANSGNLSQMIGGQKTAMDNAAQLTQQNANQAATLQANMAAGAQGQYAGAAAAQAGQAAQNAQIQQQQTAQQQLQTDQLNQQAGMANQQALGYGNLANTAAGAAQGGQLNALGIEQTALGQTGQNKAAAVGGVLNAAGSAGSAMAMSDENTKKDVKDMEENPFSVISKGFADSRENSKVQEKEPRQQIPQQTQTDASKKAASSIKNSFVQSDEHSKTNIHKDNKVSAFLDAIDPVSFKYKEADGQMGKTPGEHLGVIAQQVEKAPGGAAMVVETPKGKGIDLASAVGTLLAAASENHNRIQELEDLFKSKMEKRNK